MADAPIAESELDAEQAVARNTKRLQEVHERAMRRFDTVATPQQEQRAQSIADRRFVTISGAQWEGIWGQQFENAPRPEVDKITKSLEKIETDYRENRLIVDFMPGDDASTQETADMLDGVYLADNRHFKSQQARDNAFQEGIRGGFGAWRVTVEYADLEDPEEDDLRINPAMTIVDADQCVFFDIGSKLQDKSDAKWAFVVTADPRAEAEMQWGSENIADWPLKLWKYAYDWYTPDVVKTAEYYEIEFVADKLLNLTHKDSGETQRFWKSEIEDSDLRDLRAEGWAVKAKDRKRKRVHKYIMNGTRVLKDLGYIAGPNIPIVPFYYRRDFLDNMERWRGYPRKKIDPQRIYNSRIAKLLESDSLAPREIPIFAAQQMPPHLAQMWAEQNVARHPYALVEPLLDANGQIVTAGPIGKIESPQMPPVTAALVQSASSDLTDDDDTVDEVKANTSAEAMDIAAQRVDQKSAIPLDNMRQAVEREGEIYLGMAREYGVYARRGRKLDTLDDDGKDGSAVVGELFVDDAGAYRLRNDLSQGRYKVVAGVQESTATKRQKTVKQNIALAEIAGQVGDNQLGQIALLNAVLNQDGEGMQDLQKYVRQRLIGLGVIEPTPEERQQIEQAQASQSPDPTQIALLNQLQAQAGESQSKAQLNQAKSVETMASAQLKRAQAQVVGGPVSEPETPSGLDHASAGADVAERFASADLKTAQARKIDEDISERRIRRGHEMDIERRQQDLAERQAAQPRGEQ